MTVIAIPDAPYSKGGAISIIIIMSGAKRLSAARTVDPMANCGDAAKVYEDENGVIWNCMLNYTDISYGVYGNNKYYMIQMIQEAGRYMVFRRWGRVGAQNPNKSLERDPSLEKAMASFQKKFTDKSGNEWPLGEDGFVKVPQKYELIELDDEEVEEEDDDEDEVDESTLPPSSLHEQVQNVLKLICDADLISKEVAAMKLDLERLPLGKLSKKQISRGYALLDDMSATVKEIADLAKAQASESDQPAAPAPVKGARRSGRAKRAPAKTATAIRKAKDHLKELSSQFYTLIPHDFGRNLPPLIESMADIRLKIDLLQVLADIEISQTLRKERKKVKSDLNPMDVQYEMLNIKLEPLLENEEEFKTIQRYVETTHAPTHVQYTLKINSILKLERSAENEFHDTFSSVGNHRLLWHGSRLSNMIGILAKGLRVAPPEAPTNGYMFGKGIYFADSVSKSANYCWATPEQPKGVLLLAEVALGNAYPALEAEDFSYESLKHEKSADSLHGIGKMAAPDDGYETLKDGVVVPVGEFMPTDADGELLYNEFVVYRAEQVRLRYLVALEFVYEEERPIALSADQFSPITVDGLRFAMSRAVNCRSCRDSREFGSFSDAAHVVSRDSLTHSRDKAAQHGFMRSLHAADWPGHHAQDDDGVVWSCMLNYTDISYGKYGNNKYYGIQLIEEREGSYKVFKKWGRVGAKSPAQTIDSFGDDLDAAQRDFKKKFREKSGNSWPLQGDFNPKPKKYVLIGWFSLLKSRYLDDENGIEMLICDTNVIVKEVLSLNIDLKRMPLGKLSQAQISRGYSILEQLSDTLQAIEDNSATPSSTRRGRRATSKSNQVVADARARLKQLSSAFYTLIPHDFGRRLPPVINTMDEVRKKIELLEVLNDLEISQELQNEANPDDESVPKVHPLDAQYERMQVNLEPLLESDEEYQMIQRYIETTADSYRFRISNVLKLARPAEELERHQDTFKAIGNHRLLWHGSRVSNMMSILAKGLRIAPPEAPCNGYMFGKGIYFADALAKSANYCYTSSQQRNGVLVLAEVALGTPYPVSSMQYLDLKQLQAKRADSTHAMGTRVPSPASHVTIHRQCLLSPTRNDCRDDGVVVTMGKLQAIPGSGGLLFNEFVVYRPEQVKLRYSTHAHTHVLHASMFGTAQHMSSKRRVDPLASCGAEAYVHVDQHGEWNCMLNFTDISYGTFGYDHVTIRCRQPPAVHSLTDTCRRSFPSNNKYYMLQLAVEPGRGYTVFRKWGRVGAKAPSKSSSFFGYDLEKAQKDFQKKFVEKSGNVWPLEGPFKPVAKKYVLIDLEDEDDQAAAVKENVSPEKLGIKSELPERVQDVLKLISNADLIMKEVSSMQVDLKRMPLGKLSKTQILRGYGILDQLSHTLKELEDVENAKAKPARGGKRATKGRRSAVKGTASVSDIKARLKQLSSEFYTLIPHDFGRSLPPVIDTVEALRTKIELLEVLGSLEISQDLEAQANATKNIKHPLDAQYERMNIKMEPVLETDNEFKIIEQYITSTASSYKFNISNILKVARPAEETFEDTFSAINNHRLLWHGSRLSNMVSILATGLRIAPPEAPRNGYNFGKGLYFADAVAKSAAYCYTSRSQPKGVLLLGEVALGKTHPVVGPTYMDLEKLKAVQAHSTHALGRMVPSEKSHITMDDGVVVPAGQLEPAVGGGMYYNEFIVYQLEQVKLRYVIVLDFLNHH
ncbi:TPA: hypothetical protein N0F65_000118 [Lagenidium giganteum]|uniref:Poly [ADP-ribose] polymerase n=1 Tax=Lagenidium giganteum TaxID=4803 RepID=A0AAV2YYM8_9STRA|nr:TPA: hypothetical protein N0F65_000118 [Lagenidium giganteum]